MKNKSIEQLKELADKLNVPYEDKTTKKDLVELLEAEEMKTLKAKADKLGIPYSNNIKYDTLKSRVEEALTPKDKEEPKTNNKKTLRQQLIERDMKLVRIRITNMNPEKKDWKGEIISVANEYIGEVKKYVPYSAGSGGQAYHVPQCILNVLQDRKFVNKSADKEGGIPRLTEANEFSIEILPPLTKEEIAKLASAQKSRGEY